MSEELFLLDVLPANLVSVAYCLVGVPPMNGVPATPYRAPFALGTGAASGVGKAGLSNLYADLDGLPNLAVYATMAGVNTALGAYPTTVQVGLMISAAAAPAPPALAITTAAMAAWLLSLPTSLPSAPNMPWLNGRMLAIS